MQLFLPLLFPEILWKMRRWGKLAEFSKAFTLWKESPNIIIDSFDTEILDLMLQNETSEELHDEIIADDVSKISNQDY